MNRRITLINTLDYTRDWAVGDDAPSRIVFGSFFKVIRHTMNGDIREALDDIERVVIDRTATPAEFLELLGHLSDDFAGDVVYVRDGESAYVSSIGRRGGRVLYSLRAEDIRFYLET